MRTRLLGAGLFFLTFATLLLEILDARLLSVLTWYHLSFFAVSLAMLGMAAGAVFVFVRPDRFDADRAPRSLARITLPLAVCHPAVTCAQPRRSRSSRHRLFRDGGPVRGRLDGRARRPVRALGHCRHRGADAVRRADRRACTRSTCRAPPPAALLVVPLLERSNVSSAIFRRGAAAAAVAAACFYRFAGSRGGAEAAGVLAVAVWRWCGQQHVGRVPAASSIPKNRQLWLLGFAKRSDRMEQPFVRARAAARRGAGVPLGAGRRRRAAHAPVSRGSRSTAKPARRSRNGTATQTRSNGCSYDVTSLPYYAAPRRRRRDRRRRRPRHPRRALGTQPHRSSAWT